MRKRVPHQVLVRICRLDHAHLSHQIGLQIVLQRVSVVMHIWTVRSIEVKAYVYPMIPILGILLFALFATLDSISDMQS